MKAKHLFPWAAVLCAVLFLGFSSAYGQSRAGRGHDKPHADQGPGPQEAAKQEACQQVGEHRKGKVDSKNRARVRDRAGRNQKRDRLHEKFQDVKRERRKDVGDKIKRVKRLQQFKEKHPKAAKAIKRRHMKREACRGHMRSKMKDKRNNRLMERRLGKQERDPGKKPQDSSLKKIKKQINSLKKSLAKIKEAQKSKNLK